jgi:hypothetical protein
MAWSRTGVRVPEQRLLSEEEEAFDVCRQFRGDHPYRMRLISRILGWGDLREDAQICQFVHQHPFIGFRPTTGS